MLNEGTGATDKRSPQDQGTVPPKASLVVS